MKLLRKMEGEDVFQSQKKLFFLLFLSFAWSGRKIEKVFPIK